MNIYYNIDDIYESMSLTLKEAYYTEETKMGPQPHYNRKI